MEKIYIFSVIALICAGAAGIVAAEDPIDISGEVQSALEQLDNSNPYGIKSAMELLEVTKESPGLCVLTDAGYVKVNGFTTESCIETLRKETGCSVGNGNLLMIHRAIDKPLWFVIFENDTKDCVYTVYNNGEFEQVMVNIDGENNTISENWNASKEALGSNAFGIVTIANAWGYNAPYDFLKCMEFHNHFCPGLTSGYQLANYLVENYPLDEDEKYVVISCPVWCKDDALQIILDTTVGKKGMFVKNMQPYIDVENTAGIFIIWNSTNNNGTGYVLTYDFDKAKNISGITPDDWKNYPMESRIKMDCELMPYLDQPEEFITTKYTFEVTSDLLIRMEIAGVDPYLGIGFLVLQ